MATNLPESDTAPVVSLSTACPHSYRYLRTAPLRIPADSDSLLRTSCDLFYCTRCLHYAAVREDRMITIISSHSLDNA